MNASVIMRRMAKFARKHEDLEVYRKSVEAAMQIFECSRMFPHEEKYSLTDQVRRSSRSVSANIAEAWRKRRYQASFISKLSDAEAEAAETQVWLHYAVRCAYLTADAARPLYQIYDELISTIVGMINNAERWCLTRKHDN